MRTSYRPGQWNAIVGTTAIVVLPAQTDAALIAEVWGVIGDDADLGAIVDRITAGSGGSFADLPEFAAVTFAGDTARIAVRGAPEIVVVASTGEERIDGREVTTWSERLVRGASRLDVVLAEGETTELPLVAGVVRVAALAAQIGEADIVAPVLARTAQQADEAAPVVAAPADAEPIVPSLRRLSPAAGSAPAPMFAPAPPPAAAPPVAVPSASAPSIPEEPAPEAPQTEPDESAPAEPEPTASEPDVSESNAPADSVDTLMPEDVASASDIDEFDLLWGETVHKPIDRPAATTAPVDGDHDGATISVAEARAMRGQEAPVSPDAPTMALPVTSASSTGRIVLSTGQTAELDRTVIIGRRPRSTRASGASLPHLIAVESPQQDISRSHLEIRPEQDTVVAIDLHTTNGSTLLRPGADPVRLHPGEQTLVLSGDVIDLGDGVRVTFEDLP
ncbi:FHA domain-containing protein [Microbacterium sp. M28]|uniref:FHA domain-containing protein n=1 Tax=Microbacterium sp. M28 TaxID=2962064 RepID=UPI0021F48758|nr:FHA domain-containing protein [Microbacterium sp. M28]UYO96692.1 FHA domain-containing protein [Microbacterium sp. M28]